jgi:hypothetical protein
MIWEGEWPSGSSVGKFSTVGLCTPIPFGSTDGEPEEALEGGELDSAGGEEGQRSFADADASGDGLAERARPGIESAMVGTFVFPCANADAVVSGSNMRLVIRVVSSEPLPAWFVESTEGGFPAICGFELGNALTGMGSGIGGRGTRNAKAGFDPAAGGFFVAAFAAGPFEGVVVVPVCGDTLAGTAEACVVDWLSGAGAKCAAQTSAKLIPERADEFVEFTNAVGSAAPASGMTELTVEVTVRIS